MLVEDLGTTISGYILHNRFKILNKIKHSEFLIIYTARDLDNGKKVSLKIATSRSRNSILYEIDMIQKLQFSKHACRFFYTGKIYNLRYVVTTLEGPNLSELRSQQNHKVFPLSTIIKISIQLLRAIEDLQTIRYVHLNVTPHIFAIGGTDVNLNRIFLVDLMNTSRFSVFNSIGDSEPIRLRNAKILNRYSSWCSMENNEIGRVDNLWSLLYLLLEMRLGKLPWSQMKSFELMSNKKKEYDLMKLLAFLPHEYSEFYLYLRTLSSYAQPNYRKISTLLQSAASRYRIENRAPLNISNSFFNQYSDIKQESKATIKEITKDKMMLKIRHRLPSKINMSLVSNGSLCEINGENYNRLESQMAFSEMATSSVSFVQTRSAPIRSRARSNTEPRSISKSCFTSSVDRNSSTCFTVSSEFTKLTSLTNSLSRINQLMSETPDLSKYSLCKQSDPTSLTCQDSFSEPLESTTEKKPCLEEVKEEKEEPQIISVQKSSPDGDNIKVLCTTNEEPKPDPLKHTRNMSDRPVQNLIEKLKDPLNKLPQINRNYSSNLSNMIQRRFSCSNVSFSNIKKFTDKLIDDSKPPGSLDLIASKPPTPPVSSIDQLNMLNKRIQEINKKQKKHLQLDTSATVQSLEFDDVRKIKQRKTHLNTIKGMFKKFFF